MLDIIPYDMDPTADIMAALRWAELKAQLDAMLAPLSAADQRRMLAELLAARSMTASNPVRPVAPAEPELRKVSHAEPEPSEPDESEEPVIERVGSSGHKTEQLVTYLAEHPNATIAEMTLAVYDTEEEDSKAKVRSMLYALKKQGRVKPGSEKGRWKAA